MRLLLFDIDGTLVDTRGAGLTALLDAVEEVFEVERTVLPPLDLAGATDFGVVNWLFGELGCEPEEGLRRRYLDVYLRYLELRLNESLFGGVTLPGVRSLLAALEERGEAVTLGLLTGNVREGAMRKLRRFDLAQWFEEGAFGDDAADRNLLGPIAVRRFDERLGYRFEPEEVIVIGDTTRDVACARAMGARCLAVATGTHERERLQQAGAWQCLDDLTDTGRVTNLLLA
jgi:phosphoglycolate phosphatase